jgi:cold shock protein
MSVGKVKWFNDAKGYGFITHPDGRDVFVHYSSIEGDGFRTLNPGQEVEYEWVEGPKGLHASMVRKLESQALGAGHRSVAPAHADHELV